MRILRAPLIVLGLAAVAAACGGKAKPAASPPAVEDQKEGATDGAPPAPGSGSAAPDEDEGGAGAPDGADPDEGGE